MPSSRIALFASVSNAGAASAVIEWEKEAFPSADQLLRRPLALLALVPDGAVLFSAGTISGAAAKSVTAPFDRVKLLMQTHGLRVTQGTEKKAFGFIDAITLIGKGGGH